MLVGPACPFRQAPGPEASGPGATAAPDKELVITDDQADLLVRTSAAAIDHKLAGERAKLFPRGRSHTKPGTLLKSQTPVRTRSGWDDAVPGLVETYLVGHEGATVLGNSASPLQ